MSEHEQSESPSNHTLDSWRSILPAAAGSVVMVAALGQALLNGFARDSANPILWLALLSLFVIVSLLPHRTNLSWLGYPQATLLLAWLSLGLSDALAVTILGACLVAVLYRQLGDRIGLLPVSDGQLVRWAFTRIAVSGASLFAADAVYRASGLAVPLTAVSSTNGLPLVLAYLLAQTTVALVSDALLIRRPAPSLRALSQRRTLLWIELILPSVVISTAVTVAHLSETVLIGILGLAAVEMISNRRAVKAGRNLAERVEELSRINAIGEVIASSLVMDDLLLRVYEQVRAICDAPAFYVALFPPSGQALEYRLIMVDGQTMAAPPADSALAQYVAREQVTLHISNQTQLRLLGLTPTPLEARYEHVCALPLLAGGQTLGVMVVLDRPGHARLNPATINLLRAVAGQAALAIQNANLYAQSVQTAQNLSLINSSVHSAVTSVDREQAARTIGGAARVIARADGVALYLRQRQSPVLDLAYAEGLSSAEQNVLGNCPHGFPSRRAEPNITSSADPSDEGLALRRFAEQAELGGLVDILLKHNNALLGYITLVYHRPVPIRQEEYRLLETLAGQVATALENSDLFQALEDYAFQMSQLAHLSRVSTSNLDVDTVMTSIAQILCQMLDVSRASLILVRADGRAHSISASGPATQPIVEIDDVALFPELAALLGGSTTQPIIRQGETLSPELDALMKQYGIASIAQTPLVMNDETTGAMLLGSRNPHAFGEREWQLIDMAAHQTASHLRNAQLYTATTEALKKRMDQLALMEKIARQISNALDFGQIVDSLLDATARITQADYVGLLLKTPLPQTYVIYHWQDGGRVHQSVDVIEDERGIFNRVIHTASAHLTKDTQHDPNYIAPPGNAVYRSSATVPLKRETEVIGVLDIASVHVDFFRQEHLDFLSSLTDHTVISIDKARMLHERQYQVRVLSQLQALALRLASATDPYSVADTILETARTLFDAQETAIYLFDDRSKELTPVARVRPQTIDDDAAPGLLFPEIAAEAAQTGEVQIERQEEAGTTVCAISIPLRQGSWAREVLTMGFDTARTFSDREMETLSLLASQAAGHLGNAILHEEMQTILRSTHEGILLFDVRGRLVEANPAAHRLLERSWDDYLSRAAATLPTLATTSERMMRRQFEQDSDNGPRYLDEVSLPVTGSHDRITGWLTVLRDITEERQLADYREEISHMVVHDLRGPLAAIMSSLSLVLEELPDEDATGFLRQAMLLSMDSANNLMVLVESMLDVARLEARVLVLAVQPANAFHLVEHAVQALSATVRQSGIDLSIEIPADLPALLVDADMIRRVVINLLDNAIRYTPINGKIVIDAAPDEPGWLLFRLADSGPGIPPEDRERVFEKYQQARSPREVVRKRGSGLGLTFCKLAVEAHGGKIWIEPSGPLGGACFAFTLPTLSESETSGHDFHLA